MRVLHWLAKRLLPERQWRGWVLWRIAATADRSTVAWSDIAYIEYTGPRPPARPNPSQGRRQ